jgi:hypothetical protein
MLYLRGRGCDILKLLEIKFHVEFRNKFPIMENEFRNKFPIMKNLNLEFWIM